MAKRTGRDLLKEAQAKFVGAPVPAGTPRAPRIQPARGVQGMAPAVDGRAAQAFISAPRTVPLAPARGRRAGTSIPVSRGIQELAPAATRNIQAQPSAPTVVNSPPASSRVRPSRVRLGSAARLNILGFAMGLPQAVQREAEYQRERSRREREKP